MRRVLIILYSVFSIIAFIAITVITFFLLYKTYQTNSTSLNNAFSRIRDNTINWTRDYRYFESEKFRSKMKKTLEQTERLFIISIYSQADGLKYHIEKKRRGDIPYIKSRILSGKSRTDPDWTGRPVYENLPLIRGEALLKLFNMPEMYIKGIYSPLTKNEISNIIKWGFFALIVWLMITIILRLFLSDRQNNTEYSQRYATSYGGAANQDFERNVPSAIQNQNIKKENTQRVSGENRKDSGNQQYDAADNQNDLKLFSPQTGLVWQQNLAQRLKFEINRTASFNQDMVLAYISVDQYKKLKSFEKIRIEVAHIILDIFPFQDLAFEYEENCYAVILPDQNLNEGIKNLEIFLKKIMQSVFMEQTVSVSIGLSSRNGRLLSENILMKEAESALNKAIDAGGNKIVAFKSDPDKYRKTLSGKVKGNTDILYS